LQVLRSKSRPTPMWPISAILAAGRLLRAFCGLYDLIRFKYIEHQKNEVSLELKIIKEKILEDTLGDDDIRAANKRLRDKTSNRFS